jgi:hypothetical protein
MDSAVFVDSGSYHTPKSKYTGSLAVSLSISTLKCSVCNITVKWLYTLLDAEPTLVFPLVVAYFMIGYAVSVMSLVCSSFGSAGIVRLTICTDKAQFRQPIATSLHAVSRDLTLSASSMSTASRDATDSSLLLLSKPSSAMVL